MKQIILLGVLTMLIGAATAHAGCNQAIGLVTHGSTNLLAQVEGDGPPVLMIPSLGRGPADFDALARDLVKAGHSVIRYSPRWFGPSDGPEEANLADLAADAAAVARAACPGEAVTVVGHALGNRIARAMSAAQPAQVASVILLAAGGQVAIPPDVARAIALSVAQGRAPDADRLAALRLAFFAPGQDASIWLDGWNPRAAELQAKAVRASSDADWSAAGKAPLLIIQPMHDPVAPLANAQSLVGSLGKRVTLVTLDHASHAILPEQPTAIAAVLRAWLAGMRNPKALQSIISTATTIP